MPLSDPVCRAEYNKLYRERNRKNLVEKAKKHWHSVQKFRTDENRELRSKRRYGVTKKDFDELFKRQNGQCKLCRENLKAGTKSVHIDHCHKTKNVRGILCARCNLGIGRFGDNIDGMMEAVRYLINTDSEPTWLATWMSPWSL